MAFFDAIGATLSNMGSNVSSKTKTVVEVSNINGQIKACEDQLNRTYLEIGKLYYEQHKNDSTYDEGMAEKIAKVDEAFDAIAQLREQLNRAKGTVNCSSCGAVIPAGTVFCSKCGNKVEAEVTTGMPAQEETTACPQCGTANKVGAAFCINCGEKLQ